jgi:hypothetical protein
MQTYFDVSTESPTKYEQLEEKKKVKVNTVKEKQMKFYKFYFNHMHETYIKWKCELHYHYKLYSTNEERMAHPPQGIPEAEWKEMIDIYAHTDFQVWDIA